MEHQFHFFVRVVWPDDTLDYPVLEHFLKDFFTPEKFPEVLVWLRPHPPQEFKPDRSSNRKLFELEC